MSKLERIIHDNSNGLDYILVGEIYLPLIAVPEEKREIGFYGSLHRNYLKDYKSGLYSYLTLSGKLWTYLADLNEQCLERRDFLMEQIMEQEGITEELKSRDQMEWVRRANNARSRVDEIILNNDKSPSMKVDRRYYCFGCGCTGDAIDFTAQLFDIGLKDAAMKLADDFGIPYSGRDRGSPQNRRSVSAKKPEPTPEELWQKKHLRCLRAYLDYLSLLLEWKEQYAPKTRTEEWHEKFMTALRELSVVEYYLDILLFGDRADKEALVKEKWKEVERIEQCEREDKGDRHKRTERCHERNVPDGR